MNLWTHYKSQPVDLQRNVYVCKLWHPIWQTHGRLVPTKVVRTGSNCQSCKRCRMTHGNDLQQAMSQVEIMGVVESNDPPVMVHDPGHPDADEEGYVAYPNVNVLEEMVDLMTTARTYEANANVLEVTEGMASNALEIGR